MTVVQEKGQIIAVLFSDDAQIVDGQSALDTAMSISWSEKTNLIAIEKEVFDEEFFDLSNGLAGEILQKFINYHVKVALFGDFSIYPSESLQALIRESNRGSDFFFVKTQEEAIGKLASIS